MSRLQEPKTGFFLAPAFKQTDLAEEQKEQQKTWFTPY